jgi:predicted metalloprotease with PDZ domain
VRPFFQDHVYGIKQIDFNKYLQLIGLQYSMEWKDVLSNDNSPAPDLRVFSYQLPAENIIRIGITTPLSCWGKAGLHTGDILKAVNGTTISTTADFRQLVRSAKRGDTIVLDIGRPAGIVRITVTISSYQQAVVHLFQSHSSTEKQQKLYRQWSAGN